LLVESGPVLPVGVRDLLASHEVELLRIHSCHQACDPRLLSQAEAVVVCAPLEEFGPDNSPIDIPLLADALSSHRLTGVVLSRGTTGVVPGDDDPLVVVSPDITGDELWGRVATIRQYRPRLRRMEKQLAVMQRLGKKLNQNFVEMDQELHLASRLQRDFLPKRFPEIDDVRFAAFYRPAGWVSGDVYDVRRLDETHLSVYLADAVGHGVAAGLLTMFIKQAIIGKRIENDSYTIVPPSDVLEMLNVELAEQQLPNCQFVTACYATIDTQTHKVVFARGGHPHPIHVSVDGTCTEVRTVGGLLGVFAGENFPTMSLPLHAGEKLVFYSDGLEDYIVTRRQRNEGDVTFSPHFLDMARHPANIFVEALSNHIDDSEGSIAPADDMTLVVVERLAS